MTSLNLKLITPLDLNPTFSIDLRKKPTIHLKITNNCLIQNMNLFSFVFYFGDITPSNDYKKLICTNDNCKNCINISIHSNSVYFGKCIYNERFEKSNLDIQYYMSILFLPYKSLKQ